MKQRLFNTNLLTDIKFSRLSQTGKHLVMYLHVSPHLGLTNYHRIPDAYICADCAFTPNELAKAKAEVEAADMGIRFVEGVIVVATEYVTDYSKGKTQVAYEREMALYRDIHTDSHTAIDTGMHSGSHTAQKPEIRNQKTENKPRARKENPTEDRKSEFLAVWNRVYETNYTSSAGFESNYDYWAGIYAHEDILKAAKLSRKHKFWGDKMTPTMFFRRKNPQGEGVDYIAEMLNMQDANGQTYSKDNDELFKASMEALRQRKYALG